MNKWKLIYNNLYGIIINKYIIIITYILKWIIYENESINYL